MKKLLANFVKCGTVGWCLEIIFTACDSLRRRQMNLKGNTSLWMFPIYGMASFLLPVCRLFRNRKVWLRGSLYTFFIFLTEYVTGSLLKKHRLCPWDYSRARFNLNGVIRLDYAPYWFVTGLLYEKLLTRSRGKA